jgi:hypothetical protein
MGAGIAQYSSKAIGWMTKTLGLNSQHGQDIIIFFINVQTRTGALPAHYIFTK